MSDGRWRARLVAAVVAVVVTSASCTVGPNIAPLTPEHPAPGVDATTTPAPEPDGDTAVADVVERLAPSVVTVRTGNGLGSGVVYRSDVIVTNAHVVEDAREVSIGFADGTSSPGVVLATDAITDLAVVRTERQGLPVPEFRRDLPRPGDPVIAIGSPLGFEGSVTAGIVSGLDRTIPGSAAQSRALVDLIQIDAPISPGNSGGALLDRAGRVIGINEAYVPPTVGAVALGFAIPAATAVDVAEQLLADGTATHPFLGITPGRLTPSISRTLGVTARGALVLDVRSGGPAAAAGVRAGDVVISLDRRPVASVEELLGVLRDTRVGQETTITVLRDGSELPPADHDWVDHMSVALAG